MDLNDTPELAEYRTRVRAWLDEYGGQGLGRLHQVVVNQEIGRAGAPGLFDVIGVGMLGPTLIAHGTEDQKQRHLGPMLAADKVWTTNAQHAAFGLLLARTDPDVPKHRWLTMFILPMDAEGVSVRPLRQISGDAHFNEVFMDDVRLEPGSEVGPVDGGWGVAMTTLMFERVAIGLGGEGFGWRADRFAAMLVEDEAGTRDPEVRHRFGRIAAEFLALRFTSYRMLTMLQRGTVPGPEGALAKVTTVRAAVDAGELIVDVLGPGALGDERAGRLVSDMPGIKSAGGTEEILRSMVGERVLALPPEPRLDNGVPFAELRARERAASS